MIDAAKERCRSWAAGIDGRHLSALEPEALRRFHRDEQGASEHLRRAMAGLDFALFVTAFVHYRDERPSKQKVIDLNRVCGPMSRRVYWDQLDRVHHFVAGFDRGIDAGVMRRQ